MLQFADCINTCGGCQDARKEIKSISKENSYTYRNTEVMVKPRNHARRLDKRQ